MSNKAPTTGRGSAGHLWFRSLWVTLPALLVLGCGPGLTLAPVSGKVTYKGQPVSAGTIVFTPAAADENSKPAVGEVKDGSYTLSTTGKANGAMVGMHKVRFNPPEPVLTEEQRSDPKYNAPRPQYSGLGPKQLEVEVKSGPNTIDIELVPR